MAGGTACPTFRSACSAGKPRRVVAAGEIVVRLGLEYGVAAEGLAAVDEGADGAMGACGSGAELTVDGDVETPVRFLGKETAFHAANMLEEETGQSDQKSLRFEPFEIQTVRIPLP